uniref:PD-(D/E)XK nuclease superfamily protein n=1 Tax=Candidatus Kentrum sp. FW TaxID=2126338 RepID=A0A450SGF3_9GAMM|nr:MAG: hypothetical protein BECKFW1821A_GA0114235_103418 [Candidatus Kentron sp. FW]
MTDLTERKVIHSMRNHLPRLLRSDPVLSESILTVTREHFPTKVAVEDRFTRMLNELAREREAQTRKWEEQKAEDKRKWDEQNRKWDEQKAEDKRKWDEQNRKWDEQKAEDNHKWDEQNCKWEEQKAEDNRKWDEQNRKWDEQKAEDNRKWDEQNRKWDEQKAEDKRKWDEQNRKWEESSRRFDEVHREIMAQSKKLDRSIGALGARWGLQAESAFRDAMAAILVENFGVEVVNVNEFDDAGEVFFGRPDQVELDVIIKNGLLIICELKSSVSKSDMYTFERKVRFYEKRHQRKASRMIVVSPMIDDRARPVGERLGIEMYPDSPDVPVTRPETR